jgi:hypothetical protein
MEKLGSSATLPANDNKPVPEAANDGVTSTSDKVVTIFPRKAVG